MGFLLYVLFTMKITTIHVEITRLALDLVDKYGSGFLVTGLILFVLTLASNSGLVCSSSSKLVKSHSQAITACRRFQNSMKAVAGKKESVLKKKMLVRIKGGLFDFLVRYPNVLLVSNA